MLKIKYTGTYKESLNELLSEENSLEKEINQRIEWFVKNLDDTPDITPLCICILSSRALRRGDPVGSGDCHVATDNAPRNDTSNLKLNWGNNSDDTRLDNHRLTRKMAGKWAFSITDDVRIVYEKMGRNVVRFLAIGGHEKVYKWN